MKEYTTEVEPNIVKQREQLYRLIISQLFYDGYSGIALNLSNQVMAEPPCPPSDRLLHLVLTGLKHEPDRQKQNDHHVLGLNPIQQILIGPGIDLEYETDVRCTAPEPASYETAYVTSHKGFCRAGAFSVDGQLIATGSADASIKILDVDRMLAKSAVETFDGGDMQSHPVIRTLYDHTEEVTCVEFHPSAPILASGSRDFTVKMFDYGKTTVKKAHKTMVDVEHIMCMSFHPSGEYLVVGTNAPVIRLYDTNTVQCYVCSMPSHQHTAAVVSLKYAPGGKYYVSGSRDGSIKLWDSVSNKCVNTFAKAHSGAEVCSVLFSRNGKYILSSGKDSLVKLWELSTSRCLIAYTGAGTAGKQGHRAQAVFNHTEDYVLFPDEATTSLCVWNSRNASRQELLSLEYKASGPRDAICNSPSYLCNVIQIASKMSNIERIIRQATVTFNKSNHINFHENFSKLVSLTNQLTLKDVNVEKEFISYHDNSKSKYGKQNPVIYISIFKDCDIHITMFILKSASKLPLHDHPLMYGILKVLSGTIHLHSFTTSRENLKTFANEAVKTDSLLKMKSKVHRAVKNVNDVQAGISFNSDGSVIYENEETVFYPYKLVPLPVRNHAPIVVGENDTCSILTPTDRNFHEIRSINGPSAFFDILSPAYHTPIFDSIQPVRECTYFKRVRDVSLSDDEYLLLPHNDGNDYWCVEMPYKGPKICTLERTC